MALLNDQESVFTMFHGYYSTQSMYTIILPFTDLQVFPLSLFPHFSQGIIRQTPFLSSSQQQLAAARADEICSWIIYHNLLKKIDSKIPLAPFDPSPSLPFSELEIITLPTFDRTSLSQLGTFLFVLFLPFNIGIISIPRVGLD